MSAAGPEHVPGTAPAGPPPPGSNGASPASGAEQPRASSARQGGRSRLTKERLRLQRKGYTPVPLEGKAPFLPSWTEHCPGADEAEVLRWETTFTYPGKRGEPSTYRGDRHTNTGIQCDGVAAVDIDVLDPELAGRLTTMAEAMLGATPLHRVGQAPKAALLYRADAPRQGIETPEMRLPDGSKAQVEILGAGRQLAAFGRHPDTRKNYIWTRSSPLDVPRADLPAVTAEGLSAFRDAAEALLIAAGAEPLAPAREPPSGTADGPPHPPPDSFFGRVNHRALERLETWMPALFPTARREQGTSAWRVSSADLGRDLEEDLSMHPVHGGRDFGTEASRSPIDVVMEHGDAPNAPSAALWLCKQMGVEPTELGWRSGDALDAEEPEPSKLRLLSPADCAASKPRGYVVKGFIAPRDVLILFGPPGAGKSVIGPHIAYAVARGAPVFGRRTKAGPVLYVAAEDPHGMRQRVTALRLGHGDAPGFFLVEGVSDLLGKDSGDPAALRAVMERFRPALVVIDTVAVAFPGLRENESEDMSRVVALARSLTEWGAAVVLVHHAPKGDDSTPRGHGVLNGAADVTIRLAPDAETKTVVGRMGKNRNGPSDGEFAFRILPVGLGEDEDGDPITAPALEEADGAPAPAAPKLTGTEHSALAILQGMLGNGRESVPEAAWRQECEDRRISDAKDRDGRTKAFRRAVRALVEKKRIMLRGENVSLSDWVDEVFDYPETAGEHPPTRGEVEALPEPDKPDIAGHVRPVRPGESAEKAGRTGQPP